MSGEVNTARDILRQTAFNVRRMQGLVKVVFTVGLRISSLAPSMLEVH